MGNSSPALRLGHIAARQLALRTSVSSTSVTVITPGAGCSITSTATVSTTGATGCLIRRATFFTAAARLDLALATVFAAEALPALARLAGFLLGSFPRFWAFDCFLRLAMIVPLFWLALCAKHSVGSKEARPSPDNPLNELSTELERARVGVILAQSDWGNHQWLIIALSSPARFLACPARPMRRDMQFTNKLRTALYERLGNDPQISNAELVTEHDSLEAAIHRVEEDLLLSAMRRFVKEETAPPSSSSFVSKVKEFVCSGRSAYWVKVKNPKAPAVTREAEEDWAR